MEEAAVPLMLKAEPPAYESREHHLRAGRNWRHGIRWKALLCATITVLVLAVAHLSGYNGLLFGFLENGFGKGKSSKGDHYLLGVGKADITGYVPIMLDHLDSQLTCLDPLLS